ncbi:DNA mismatch repair protein MutS [Deferribacterales bacterium]|nr:DNA mismatch repair protein MutS [Deferribacterales bacterium]
MKQLATVKAQYPDAIIFCRVGDFYEVFGEDAITTSKVLGIALTSRNKTSSDPLPMCGVPYRAYQQYMLKMIRAGYKVAIYDQLEAPALAKGIIKRGITRIVSPGTVIDEVELPDAANNFIVAIYRDEIAFYVAAGDISTGEIHLTQTTEQLIDDTITAFQPKEIITTYELSLTSGAPRQIMQPATTANAIKAIIALYEDIEKNKRELTLKDLGIENKQLAVPFEMILRYVKESMLDATFARPKTLSETGLLTLDSIAIRALELVYSPYEGGRTLMQVLNRTSTSMGARLLQWKILRPSRDVAVINKHLDIVEYFTKNNALAEELDKLLSSVYDVERITNRISAKRVSARELVWLRDSLLELPRIADILESSGIENIANLGVKMKDAGLIADMLMAAIADEPPQTLTAGGIIKTGYNKTVDSLRSATTSGGDKILALESRLREQTKINSLKISYNKMHGYYVEVTRANLHKVPHDFERVYTLVNAERFITPEIQELAGKILGAEERLVQLEYDLFCSVRDMVAESAAMLRATATNIAKLDLYICFCKVSLEHGYIKPIVDDSGELDIEGARHPVVETLMKGEYIPNDVHLDERSGKLMLITGPNMAGKSTYMRSIALVALIAHIGCFVPAERAHIGVLDRIFTRVGASDNISRGQSTFMTEMTETANILRNATDKSLLIIDEIGRGTSTYDGISIAWAVVEYILDKIKAKTLFATHYFELTDIAELEGASGIKNYTVSVREMDDNVIFMRKIIPGVADKSYGIYVAKLAGLPNDLIVRAREVLGSLHANQESALAPMPAPTSSPAYAFTPVPKQIKGSEIAVRQLLIFDENHPVLERLKNIDANTMSPIEALNLVVELKKLAN